MERISQNPVAAFIPWIIFWVVADSRSTWEYGALGALIASLVLLVPDLRRRKVKMLDAATVIFFAAMTIAGIIVSPHDGEWLDRWANTISSGFLGVLVLITLPFRPFTEDYAREQTPPEVWNTPRFRRTNQVITRCVRRHGDPRRNRGLVCVEQRLDELDPADRADRRRLQVH